MRRGEVWWAELPGPAGRRPVLLLSRERAYHVRTSVTVAPITRTIRQIPTEVRVGPDDGLPVPCAVSADDLLTVPMHRLTNRITELSPAKMHAVASAVRFALDLP